MNGYLYYTTFLKNNKQKKPQHNAEAFLFAFFKINATILMNTVKS